MRWEEVGGGKVERRKEVGKNTEDQSGQEVDGGESKVMEVGNVWRRQEGSREGRKTFGVGGGGERKRKQMVREDIRWEVGREEVGRWYVPQFAP